MPTRRSLIWVASRNSWDRVRTARAASHLAERCQNVGPRRVSKPRCTRGLHKSHYSFFVGGGEIEWFVEFPGAGKFRAARTQAGIFGDLANAHVMEAGNPYGAFLGDLIQRLADFRIRPALRDAEIACRAHSARYPQTEVAVRKENPSAVLRDEGMVVPHLSPDGLDFLPGARREQNECDFSPFEFRQSLFRAGKRIVARID